VCASVLWGRSPSPPLHSPPLPKHSHVVTFVILEHSVLATRTPLGYPQTPQGASTLPFPLSPPTPSLATRERGNKLHHKIKNLSETLFHKYQKSYPQVIHSSPNLQNDFYMLHSVSERSVSLTRERVKRTE